MNVDSQVHFPPDCKIVGAVNVPVSDDGIKITKYYVVGVHKELRCYGSVTLLRKSTGDDGAPRFETEVTVTQGLPSEMFYG
jgi:hypothetical protein